MSKSLLINKLASVTNENPLQKFKVISSAISNTGHHYRILRFLINRKPVTIAMPLGDICAGGERFWGTLGNYGLCAVTEQIKEQIRVEIQMYTPESESDHIPSLDSIRAKLTYVLPVLFWGGLAGWSNPSPLTRSKEPVNVSRTKTKRRVL